MVDDGSGTKQDLFEEVGKKVEALQLERPEKAVEEEAENDDDGRVADAIESLCMSCHENGTTRLLLTRIPFFREIILMSFSCPHCGFRNSEIQSAGQIQEHGCRYSFVLAEPPDLSRQVVRSDTCTIKFVELDLEIPAGRGQLTNVEGLLTALVEDLALDQPARRSLNPEAYAKIKEVIAKGKAMLNGESYPFTLILDDPAGNSWIEPSLDSDGGRWTRSEYRRTAEQNEALALADAGADSGTGTAHLAAAETKTQPVPRPPGPSAKDPDHSEIVPDEVYSFPTACPGCTRPSTTNMKMVNIPFFKDVIIMSIVCEHCGYRSNEVKTGGAIPPQGRRITLSVRNVVDLARDILKSETCAVFCPDLGVSVQPGTMGGRFTTLEGLLTQIRDDLRAQIFNVDKIGSHGGDSLPTDTKAKWSSFFDKMDQAIRAEIPFTVILQDPAASSYVQNLCTPDEDPQLVIEDYERTEEENEDLGLNDMKVENYAEDGNTVPPDEGRETEPGNDAINSPA